MKTMQAMLTTILLAVLVGACCCAQDVILYKNGKEEKGKVLEVTQAEIKFKKQDNIDGPVYSVSRTEILTIQYANGLREFVHDSTAVTGQNFSGTRVKYNGPRFGFTMIGQGLAADHIRERGKGPFITQFGWQFETRIFTLDNGTSGLFEFVPLVGGIEQGMFLPSLTALFGVRSGNGHELAVGPNLSITGIGMAIAAGTSFRSSHVYFPVNIAIVPSIRRQTMERDVNGNLHETISHTGMRISLYVGFNSRKGQ